MSIDTSSEAILEIEYPSEREAKIVAAALSPDNKPLPKGLECDIYVDRNILVARISCRRSLLSLLVTIDDIISKAILAGSFILKEES